MSSETKLRDLARRMVAKRPNTVTATHSGVDYLGVFSMRDVEFGVGVSGVAPVFYCPSADATALVEEVVVTIESKNYTIKQVHKRASGISAFLLEDA